jgi:hypothetical protein
MSEEALHQQVDLLLEHCQLIIDACGHYVTD